MKNGVIHRYLLEDGLLHANDAKLYVPERGDLRWLLLKETHNEHWVGHPGQIRMKALLFKYYY